MPSTTHGMLQYSGVTVPRPRYTVRRRERRQIMRALQDRDDRAAIATFMLETAVVKPNPSQEPLGPDFLTVTERKQLTEAALIPARALAYRDRMAEALTDAQRKLANAERVIDEAVAAGRKPPALDTYELRVAVAHAREDLDRAGRGLANAEAAREARVAELRAPQAERRRELVRHLIGELDAALVPALRLNAQLRELGQQGLFGSVPFIAQLEDKVGYWRATARDQFMPAPEPTADVVPVKLTLTGVKDRREVLDKPSPEIEHQRALLARLHRANGPGDVIGVDSQLAHQLVAAQLAEYVEAVA